MQEPAQKLRSLGVHVFAVGRCLTCSSSSLIQISLSFSVSFTAISFLLCHSFCLLGIKSADRNELAQISSQPSSDFTSFVGDFKVLNTLLPLVSPRVCSKAGGVYASDGL